METRTKLKTKAAAPLAATVLGFVLASAAPMLSAPALAQQTKEPSQRLIEGTVVSRDDKPLSGAVVFLKDSKTLAVKTFLTDDAGHFRFGQLSLASDYDLWATMNDSRSKTRNISSFNSHPTLNYTLKLDK